MPLRQANGIARQLPRRPSARLADGLPLGLVPRSRVARWLPYTTEVETTAVWS